MSATTAVQPDLQLAEDTCTRWFSARGCVVWRDDRAEVLVGGSLIGSFTRRENGARNAILIGLASDPDAHYGRLAEAFDITSETLRMLRRLHETEGLGAVVARARGGSESKVTPAVRRKLEALFARDVSVSDAHLNVRQAPRPLALHRRQGSRGVGSRAHDENHHGGVLAA